MAEDTERFVTFAGEACVGGGTLAEAALAARRALDGDEGATVLVFDARTGAVRDLDLRGNEAEVAARHASVQAGRGRPKLGVIPREVTLLPRHWDWLAAQPGGASVALRKLVEAASKQDDRAVAERARREAAYRFMSAMAGDRPGFEEAARALFAGDRDRLAWLSRGWPADIRRQVFRCLAGEV
jgi:hypothetical protein